MEFKQRRPWTAQQDKVLMYLKEQLKIKKWTDVSKRMRLDYNIKFRSQKQCRDRYENFLKMKVKHQGWTLEDDQKLIQLYQEYGSRWSQIAQEFPNTNGIYIKNKFYSLLRKAIRNINYIIKCCFNKTFSKFSFSIIFKLVNLASNRYNQSTHPFVKQFFQENNINMPEDIIKEMANLAKIKHSQLKKMHKKKSLSNDDQINWKKIIVYLNAIQEKVKPNAFKQDNFHQDLSKKNSQRLNEIKNSTQWSQRSSYLRESLNKNIPLKQCGYIQQETPKIKSKITIIFNKFDEHDLTNAQKKPIQPLENQKTQDDSSEQQSKNDQRPKQEQIQNFKKEETERIVDQYNQFQNRNHNFLQMCSSIDSQYQLNNLIQEHQFSPYEYE